MRSAPVCRAATMSRRCEALLIVRRDAQGRLPEIARRPSSTPRRPPHGYKCGAGVGVFGSTGGEKLSQTWRLRL